MLDPFETLVHRGKFTHGILSLKFEFDHLTLIVAPFVDLNDRAAIECECFRLQYIDSSYADDEDMVFPWDIIGCGSMELPDGRFKLHIHTDAMELGWVSNWPTIRDLPTTL